MYVATTRCTVIWATNHDLGDNQLGDRPTRRQFSVNWAIRADSACYTCTVVCQERLVSMLKWFLSSHRLFQKRCHSPPITLTTSSLMSLFIYCLFTRLVLQGAAKNSPPPKVWLQISPHKWTDICSFAQIKIMYTILISIFYQHCCYSLSHFRHRPISLIVSSIDGSLLLLFVLWLTINIWHS